MNIPTIFIPERNLEKQTKNLKRSKKKGIKNLTDFIIDEGLQLSEFIESDKFRLYDDLLPFLNKVDLVDGIFIDYGNPVVEIIQFRDVHTLKLNMDNMVEYACEFVETNHESKVGVIVKDIYAGFVHASDYEKMKELVENYSKKFGFKAHKIIPERK